MNEGLLFHGTALTESRRVPQDGEGPMQPVARIGSRQCSGASKERQDGPDSKVKGFFGRAFHHVKRLGEAIDPGGVTRVEQAWNELAPELRQAAGDILQGKNELQAAGKEAAELLWSDVKQAVSGPGGGGHYASLGDHASAQEEPESAAGLGWEDLQRDAKRAASGVFSDVFGEVAEEVIATFESRLSEALSEENVLAASQQWRRLLDTPGVQLLVGDPRLWAGAERAVRQHLSEYMSEESAMMARRAVDATSDFALHFAGLSRNADKRDHEVFEELCSKLCHLQGAVEKLWPLMVRALPLIGYKDYVASAEGAIRSHVLPRITLTVAASALLGLNPRGDPFLLTVIAAFSLGHLTKDVAQNMAAFFQRVVMDQKVSAAGADREGSSSPVDLAGDLVSGAGTCQELGHKAFEFFKVVQRASLGNREADLSVANVDAATEMPTDRQESATTPAEAYTLLKKTPHKLSLDGVLLRQAIWTAVVIDNDKLSLGALVSCLIFGACLCCTVGVFCCWRWIRRRGDASRNRKRRDGVKVWGRPQPTPSLEKREKTA